MSTKRFYNKDFLEKFCIENDIKYEYLGDTKITRETIIKGSCKNDECKEMFEKKFVNLIEHGGPYCDKCIKVKVKEKKCSFCGSKKRGLCCKKKSLKERYPEVACEWHPTKNGDKFNDHNLKIVNEESSKPLKFAKIVLKEIFLNYERSKDKNPMIIFVPSDERVKSHIEMKELIQSDKNYNFWVLVHNGTEKCFYSPEGNIYNIEEYYWV